MGSLFTFVLVVAVVAFVVTQLIVPLSKGEDILPFFASTGSDNNDDTPVTGGGSENGGGEGE